MASEKRHDYGLLGLFSILLAAGTLLVHTPAQMYTANASEFTFSLAELFRRVAPALAAIVVLLCLPLLLPWPRFRRTWAVGWFAAAIVIWVSSNFLVLDIGPLDGRVTQLTVSFGFTLASIAVCIGIAAGSVLLARAFPKPAAAAALALNLLLIGTSTAAVVRIKKAAPQSEAAIKTFLRFSETRNALVIILDSFQSDLFEQIIKENPEFRDRLDGFQYFPDTVGPAPTTVLSLPAIHSGKTYDEKRTLPSIYAEDIRKGSFLVALAEDGFETSMLNPINVCADRALCTSEEIVLAGSQAAARQEYLRLLDLSMFRAAPAPVKPLVFNRGGWRARNWVSASSGDNRPYRSHKLLRALGGEGYVAGGQPVAKFIHSFITHLPVELDENCRPLSAPIPATRRALLAQARCAVEAVAGLLDDLKKMQIYDKSTVVIAADHGFDERGFANPVFLFKPLTGRGHLRISNHPRHTSEIPAMLCSDLAACPSFCPPSTPRDNGNLKRVHYYYRWRHDFWDRATIPGIRRYTIEGPVRSFDSWSRSVRPALRPGRLAAFTTDSEAEHYLDWGWSTQEAWGTWSVGEQASLSFSVEEHARRRPLRLVATLRSYLNAKHRHLTVRVQANSADVGQWDFDLTNSRGERAVLLMPDVWSPDDGGVTIRFHIESPAVPADYANSTDMRALGIGLESMVLR